MFYKRAKGKRHKPPFHNFFMIIAMVLVVYVMYQMRHEYIPPELKSDETSTETQKLPDN